MDGAGHQLLAGAGFAGQQHADRVVQHFADQLINAAHRRAVANQAIAAGAGCADHGNRLLAVR